METDIQIPTKNIDINGTLLSPALHKKRPLCIIIPGSGPTDRDGNNNFMKNNSLKYLAENLSKKGIATFRYDKSVLSYLKIKSKKIDSLTFDDFINEATEIIKHFKSQKKYSKIIVIGHSQGSLVGMIASKKLVDGFISLEGAGRTIDLILSEQIEKQAPYLMEETSNILTQLKKGNTVNDVNPLLKAVFNKPVQPFLISWMKYDPQIEFAKLTCKTLIINGSKDIQTSNLDAELLHKAKNNSQLEIIENMNHILKEVKGDFNENMATYNNPNLPIMEELSTIITTFVNRK